MIDDQARCSFCQRDEDQARFVLELINGYICDDCIQQGIDLLKTKGLNLIQGDFDEYFKEHNFVHRLITRDRQIHCTFCNKPQEDLEALIAGPKVYICTECINVCLDILEKQGRDLVQRRANQDVETSDKLVRGVTLPPEYHQAGISLMGYFGVLLRHAFPSTAVRARLELEGFTVRLVVRCSAGRKKAIESFLSNYGLIIQGKLKPGQLLTDTQQAEALAKRLSISAHELRRVIEAERTGDSQAEEADSTDERVSRLHDALGWVFRREVEDVEELFDGGPRDEP
jgi:hypothetical protein